MKLHSLKIDGYRRHHQTEILFGDATFLIGENNIGKSSVLAALNLLLNDKKTINEEEFFAFMQEDLLINTRLSEEVVLVAEFRKVSKELENSRGFKGRVLKYTNEQGDIDYRIIYRKTFPLKKDYKVEMRQQIKTIKEIYKDASTIEDFINRGLDISPIIEELSTSDYSKKITTKDKKIIEDFEEIYDYDENHEDWFENPGGIPANILSKLPKFLLIPAQDKVEELSGSKGALSNTLTELFNDVRDVSENYKQAQLFLNKLASELDPSDQSSEFGKMMGELNHVMKDVFPNTGLRAVTSLTNADKVIRPEFNISMFSNINTNVNLQGTGIIRSAVFALLRYRSRRELQKSTNQLVRPLIIGFEEPEIYLHPNASKQMRNTIYDLAGTENNQIICTTHSPYMIDLSKKPNQILNCLSINKGEAILQGQTVSLEKLKSTPFNASEEFMRLQFDDKSYVKMLLRIDDYVSRIFFCKHVLIVEGDTEDIVLRETIRRMPYIVRKDIECNWQIIKARGKASIISLVKYLKSMDIIPFVIHDKDSETPKAAQFNEPILLALGDNNKRIMLENCIEDVLGYPPPSSEKPYKAFKFIEDNWGMEWEEIDCKWKLIIEEIFYESFLLLQDSSESNSTA